TPVAVSGLTNAVAITANAFHSCALLGDGTVRCWGSANLGALGDGTTSGTRVTPVQVFGLARAVAIAAGTSHTCAVIGDGGVRCWGGNGSGQLGDGTTTTRPSPAIVTGVAGAVAITAGFAHTCVAIGTG